MMADGRMAGSRTIDDVEVRSSYHVINVIIVEVEVEIEVP